MEPLLIGFLGVTIGSIVIAMYLPLFHLIGKIVGSTLTERAQATAHRILPVTKGRPISGFPFLLSR
jgi:hypothetical protein